MKQVAALAGVSLSTVSRVVNGDPAVGPEPAERVHLGLERMVALVGFDDIALAGLVDPTLIARGSGELRPPAAT